MKTLSSDWLARNRLLILILSIIVGVTSAYYKVDLTFIPFAGILIFFFPVMLKQRELKEVYYLQIARFFLTCITLVIFLFTYIMFEDFVRGNKSISNVFETLKNIFPIFLVLYASLFMIALAFGFLWKKILNLNRVHLRVLINQFSIPLIAFFILSISLYVYVTDQENTQKNDTQWYHLLFLPGLLLIPWCFHIYGLLKMAKEKNITLPQFLYSYERARIETPKDFWALQVHSKRLGRWVILLPLCVLFFYQMFMEKDFVAIIAGLLFVSVVIFKIYRRKSS